MPAPTSYSSVQIFLHWTIAALVIFQLTVNTGMQAAFNDHVDGRPPEEMGAAVLHIVVGSIILALAIIRLSIRHVRGVPVAHADNPAVVNWLGHAAHMLLYGFIFFMPLTGLVAWFGGLEFSAELHELGRLLLIPLVALHALGALAEHFVFHNDSLRRMLTLNRDK